MSNQLIVFDTLKADLAILVEPIKSLKVVCFKSQADAINAQKQIRELLRKIDDARDDLVRPLNEQVKTVNTYAKGISEPLTTVGKQLQSQIDGFAQEQEKLRQAELRKAEAVRKEAELKAQAEAKKLAAEQEAARQEELARIRQEAKEAEEMFGAQVDTAAQIREAEELAERERLETEARHDRERLERESVAAQARYDANQAQTKNVRKNWAVEVEDINLVPKEFLIVELNEKMALASARAGNTNIAGLRFYQKISVAIGQNTYVPRAALEGGK